MADHASHDVGLRSGERQRARWSWQRRFLVGLVGVVLCLALACWVLGRAGEVRLQSEIDAIRAAGEPVTIEDIEALRGTISDEQNAALKIVRLPELAVVDVRSAISVVCTAQSEWAALGERFGREMIEAVDVVFASEEPAINAIHAAVELDRGALPITWIDGWFPQSPSLVTLHAAAELLALEAAARAYRGDIDAAMKSCDAVFAVSACLDREPFVLACIVGYSCSLQGLASLERTLALGEPDDASLRKLHVRLQRVAEDRDSFRQAILGDRVEGIGLFSSLRAEASPLLTPDSPDDWPPILRSLPGILDLDEQKYLVLMRARCDAMRLPPKESLQRMRELDDELRSLPGYCGITRMYTASLAGAARQYFRCRLGARAGMAAIEIELYRRAHGRWPATLKEVFGDDPAGMPLDPFNDDLPMRYIVDENGCTIYSFGEDEKDDGGVIESVAGRRPTDVGFRLLAPHLRGATVTTQPVDETVWEAIEALRAAATQPAATAPVR